MSSKYIYLVVFYLLLSSFCQAKEPLLIATSSIFNDPFDETSIKVLKEGYRRIGVELTFTVMPPKRAFRASIEGQIDGELHRIGGLEKKYESLIRIPIPINRIEAVVFTNIPEIIITRKEDLKPYLIGIRRGVKFAEELSQGMRVMNATGPDHLFTLLDRGRVDVIIESRVSGINQIKNMNLKGIKILEPPLSKIIFITT